ncbi:MAG: hypothetical protein E6H91_06990 [Chloroflexi bacterium]|nr:MAG: hypothetical protein E6H91_06990 [Chloroflexota bacterium]
MRRIARDDRGTSTMEFALILPVLVLLLVGIVDIARALNAYIVVGSASQEGARYAIVNPTAAPSAIASAARTRATPLDTASLAITAEYYDNAAATFRPWPSAGIPASSPNTTGVLVRISASYPWSAVSAVAGTFFSGSGSATLTTSSLMEARR